MRTVIDLDVLIQNLSPGSCCPDYAVFSCFKPSYTPKCLVFWANLDIYGKRVWLQVRLLIGDKRNKF